MALVFADRVWMITATTGTGPITLGSALASYLTFAQASIADGSTVHYVIVDGNNFELGVGTYTASGTTLSRSVIQSLIAGVAGTTLLTLSGSATVFLTGFAADVVAVTLVGDSGSGGAKGLVPAPAAGDAAANKFLNAGGGWTIPPSRVVLTANRTYYFRSDGNDSNTGLVNSAGGAFLTANKAMSVIASTLDVAGFTVTIQRGDAVDYTSTINIVSWVGGGSILLDGNARTFNVTSADTLNISGVLPGSVTFQNMIIKNTTSGTALNHYAVGKVSIGAGVTFGAASGAQIQVSGAGAYLSAVAYTINGGGAMHWSALHRGFIQVDFTTITLTGTPAFSTAFAYAQSDAEIEAASVTFSGSATGPRYNVGSLGVINTFGAGTSYFPGNAAGTGTNPSASPYGLYQ